MMIAADVAVVMARQMAVTGGMKCQVHVIGIGRLQHPYWTAVTAFPARGEWDSTAVLLPPTLKVPTTMLGA